MVFFRRFTRRFLLIGKVPTGNSTIAVIQVLEGFATAILLVVTDKIHYGGMGWICDTTGLRTLLFEFRESLLRVFHEL